MTLREDLRAIGKLFRQDRDFVAITSSRLGVQRWIYNHRVAHLVLWSILISSAFGWLVTRYPLTNSWDVIVTIFGVEMMAILIHCGITVTVIDHIKRNPRSKTILIDASLHRMWRLMLTVRRLRLTNPPSVRQAEAFMARNSNLWWEASEDVEMPDRDKRRMLAGALDVMLGDGK